MGKLAVFFTALAIQAVFGGIPRNFGYTHQEPRSLFDQDVTISGDTYEPFQKTSSHRGFPWSTKYEKQPSGSYSNEKDVKEIIKNLEKTLERIHIEDSLVKRAFVHLVREYFENLTEVGNSEHSHYYEEFLEKHSKNSVEEIKEYIFKFNKECVANLENISRITLYSFAKTIANFEKNLNGFVKVSNPVRQLVIRIQTVFDKLRNWYESIPYQTNKYHEKLVVYAQKLTEVLNQFVSKVDKIEKNPEFIENLRKIISGLGESKYERTFVVVLEKITTEIRKYLSSDSRSTETKLVVGNEFLKVLDSAEKSAEFDDPEDIDTFSAYLMAFTNKLSMYLQNDIHPEDYSLLKKTLSQLLQVLESENNAEYKQFVRAVKNIINEFESEKYTINTFLQEIILEWNQFLWTVYQQQQILPKKVFQSALAYLLTIEEIQVNQRIVKALSYVQTPSKYIVDVQIVADRFAQLLHIFTPGFQLREIDNHVRSFNQILEVLIYRLSKIPKVYENSKWSVKTVYESLQKIPNHLEAVLGQPNEDSNVHLGVQIQNTLLILRELAFKQGVEEDIEFVKLYGDFLFGLENLLNQLQFDLQVVLDRHNVKTLTLQIEYVAHRASNLLLRAQSKPELKHVILLQVQELTRQLERTSFLFRQHPSHEVNSQLVLKYKSIHNELYQVSKTGWNGSFENLCVFLSKHIDTIVSDLQHLITYKTETPEFYEIYKYFLVTFSHIMVRLENVHYYEYYYELVDSGDFVGYVQKLNSRLASKLQSTFEESPRVKYDLLLQTVLFAESLENIAIRLQVDAEVFPKGLYDIAYELKHIGSQPSVGVLELRSALQKYTPAVYTEIEKIVDHESYVGTKQALVDYAVLLEKLYFNTYSVFIGSHNTEGFDYIFKRIDIHVHYLLRSIEQIHPNNEVAINVFYAQYHGLVDYVAKVSKNLYEFSGSSDKLQYLIKKLSEFKPAEFGNHNDVNEFKVKMIEDIRDLVDVISETFWVWYEIEDQSNIADLSEVFKPIYNEFLTILQRINYEIQTKVIVNQESFYPKHLGLKTKSQEPFNYGDEYSSKYDEQYYGTFGESLKFGKKINGGFNKYFEHKTESTKPSKPEYGYNKVFASGYEPEYRFSGFSDYKFPESANKYSKYHQPGYSFYKAFDNDYETQYTPTRFPSDKYLEENKHVKYSKPTYSFSNKHKAEFTYGDSVNYNTVNSPTSEVSFKDTHSQSSYEDHPTIYIIRILTTFPVESQQYPEEY